MNKKTQTLCCLALSLSLISSAPAWAGTKLTGEAVQKLLAGKTVTGTAGKDIKFTKTYNADGTYKLEVRGETRTGKWWVRDDQYCQTRDEGEECFTVEKAGSRYQMKDKEGGTHTTFSPR